MCCNDDPISYTIQPYTAQDNQSFTNTLSTIKNLNSISKLSQFPKNHKLAFTQSGNIIDYQSGAKHSFSVSYNQILKQVSIDNLKKQHQFWYSVNDHFVLNKDDTLRVGKAVLHIHDIYPSKQHNQPKPKQSKQIHKNRKQTCRICFEGLETIDNPLLSMCKCSGSVKYMHLQCYRQWYQNKVKFYNQRKITYFQIKDIKCQLCKSKVPFSVHANGRQYTFLDYKKKFDNDIDNGMQMMIFPDLQDFNQSFDSFILNDLNQQIQLQEHSQHSLQILRSQNSQHPQVAHNQILPGLIPPQHNNNNNNNQNQKNGIYILLKSQKTNENDQHIIELILIKLQSDYRVTFGNQMGVSNVIIKNGETSMLHMSLQMVQDQIIVINHSNQLGTFIKMNKNQSYQFIGKHGSVIDYAGKKLMRFRSKPWFIQLFQPKVKFRVTLTERF